VKTVTKVYRQEREVTWGAICYPKSGTSRVEGTWDAICYPKAGISRAEGPSGDSERELFSEALANKIFRNKFNISHIERAPTT
jgi:hypothetical protein